MPNTGDTLNTTPGTWTGSPTSYAYQWQRSADGTLWTNISAATGTTYTVQDADDDDVLRSSVIATNGAGWHSQPSYSAPTAAVGGSSGLTLQTVSGVTRLMVGGTGVPALLNGVVVWGQNDSTTSNTDGGLYPSGFGQAQYNAMSTSIAGIQSWGFNFVRYMLNAGYYNSLSGPNQATYIAQFKAWHDAVTGAGLYFMPCFWDALGLGASWATGYTVVEACVVAALTAIGNDDYTIWEPFNEPNNVTFAQWQTPTEWNVNLFRTNGYTNPLLIDPPYWANSGAGGSGYDNGYYNTIESFDASTLGVSQHQIMWAKHDYANEYSGSTWSDSAWQASVGGTQTSHCILEGELGYYNGSTSTESESWNAAAYPDLLAKQSSMPNYAGLGGAFLWWWIDPNSLTTNGSTPSSPWGTIVKGAL